MRWKERVNENLFKSLPHLCAIRSTKQIVFVSIVALQNPCMFRKTYFPSTRPVKQLGFGSVLKATVQKSGRNKSLILFIQTTAVKTF